MKTKTQNNDLGGLTPLMTPLIFLGGNVEDVVIVALINLIHSEFAHIQHVKKGTSL